MSLKKSITQSAVAAFSATAILLSGCAMTETQRDTAVGAGVGAAAGGIIGNGRGAIIGAGVGALGGYAWSQYMASKKVQMERAAAGTGVQVIQTPDNRLELNAPTDISFATNSAEIRPQLRPVLDQFAAGLGSQRGLEIMVIGHTDSTGTDAINDPLSLARANSVRAYLSGRGVNPALIRTEGRGSHQPIASNDTAEGRARNRRVEIYLGQRAG
ncbi:MAG: OmpA family protein [Burkholderiaceae bacterium]|jgi:outer membrane protein OmpA-like peptidoglycan-associated protein|nr:OmpA family protein [Burkholderiaceae bacterium]